MPIDNKLRLDGGSEDRSRGILTQGDRQFLLGEKELGEQGRRDARYRIRERVKNAIYDFNLLFQFLENRDREKIFDEIYEDPRFIQDSISFYFEGITDQTESIEDALKEFSNLIEGALWSALGNRELIVEEITVDISVEAREPHPEELIEKYRQGEESPQELVYLVENDLILEDGPDVGQRLLQRVVEGSLEMRIERPAEGEEGEPRIESLGPDEAQSLLEQYSEQDAEE